MHKKACYLCLSILLVTQISGADTQSLKQRLDEYFQQQIQGRAPGAAVLVSSGGKVLYEKGYGYADIGAEISVTPQTQFRIGSTTKTFTAAAILKLQEDKKLLTSDKLSKYFPEFPRGEEITLHHLLTHTSGIHSFTEIREFFSRISKTVLPEDVIALFQNLPLDFEPGASWHYSNSGYFLLGQIIEMVSGLSYEEYLIQTFFRPLNMKNTGVHRSQSPPSHDAIGYSYRDGDVHIALDWDMSNAGAAGNLYSTVGDLFLWSEAIFNHKILNSDSLKIAFTPVHLNNGQRPQNVVRGGGYGYGWIMDTFNGFERISHAGGFHGFLTEFMRFPEKEITVVIMTNCVPPLKLNPVLAAEKIATLVLGR